MRSHRVRSALYGTVAEGFILGFAAATEADDLAAGES